MQPLQGASKAKRGRRCAEEVMSAVPPVVWYMRKQMRSHRGGLSMPQFRALVRVRQDGAASISAISEHLGTSLSTTSRLVSGLVGRGLLARETTPNDRRQVHVTITTTGREVLDKARQATRGKLEIALASVAASEEKTVIDAMEILRRIFGRGSRFDAMNTNSGRNGDSQRRKSR